MPRIHGPWGPIPYQRDALGFPRIRARHRVEAAYALGWMHGHDRQAQVRLLLALFLGRKSMSTIPKFVEVVTTSQEGLLFLGVGCISGAILSFVLFSATVIAMPLLLDRELDFISAIIVSFKTVLKSPAPMIGWGIVVVALAIIGMIPAFLGLIIIMPVLGHATWHLYEAAIGSESPSG